ncbi:MAG TPA: asparagine synthase (glutamine-hydrolyzing), partial [Afifellaceae bacterium]|nr:asparagine synthase (glutamine-hydrolyzing) [Afifellaceae bacterium]
MCGIAGFFAKDGLEAADARAVAGAMSRAIVHRGPDGSGEWIDAEAGIALAHRRLAIIDLTDAGAQPMTSASGRWVISFNGEIYNFETLRAELNTAGANPDWRGHSDTEVLLACIDAWGVEATLGKLNGMFAFAAWDRQLRELWLARDRFGEKPLYYGWAGRTFVFGSELKALRCHPDFDPSIDMAAFGQYVKYGFVPHTSSIYEGIRKLPPAGWIRLATGPTPGVLPDPCFSWDMDAAIMDAKRNPFGGGLEDAADALNGILGDAVERRMIADVPLCGLLSGGIDSSLIVALMQARAGEPISTYNIGSNEPGFDEADIARRIAAHLGTNHTVFNVEPADALEVVPQLGAMYAEPFADSSQIPTHIVSRLVRQESTVALSGDAGDELFGGYNRYFHGPRIAGAIGRFPLPVRRAAASCITALSPDAINRILRPIRAVLSAELNDGAAGEKVHKLAASMAAASGMDFGEILLSQWPQPEKVLAGRTEVSNLTGFYQTPVGV